MHVCSFTFSTSASAPLASALSRPARFPLPLPSRSSVFPCHGASPLSFRPAPRFPSRPPSRGATRESILRLKRFVNYFFQLFSSNAGERVRVNLSIFAVHNEGGARQNFLKLHTSGTAFHDLRGAPALYEKSVRSWRAGRRYGVCADFTAAALRLGDGADARLFPVDCGGFAGFRKPGEALAARRALCVRGAPLGIIAELPKRSCLSRIKRAYTRLTSFEKRYVVTQRPDAGPASLNTVTHRNLKPLDSASSAE